MKTLPGKIQLIEDLIHEDPNHTIGDYLQLLADLRAIRQQATLMKIEKKLAEQEMEYPQP